MTDNLLLNNVIFLFMKKSLTLSAMIVLPALLFVLYGQTTENNNNRQPQLRENLLSDPNQTNFLLNPNWHRGVITLQDNTTITGQAYRYNVYTDQIEVVSALSPSEIKVVEVNSKQFIYIDFLTGNDELRRGYFELVEDGPMKLLIRREMSITSSSPQSDHYGSRGGEDRIQETLYIKLGDEPAQKINPRRRDVIEFFSDNEIIQNYFDENRVLRMNESRLREIIRYYNENVE